ncbi:hypothetical protein [Accumulibacter sp.]|uniref:hypothetical protein n=1 Tax=Accumulibacter sp. TaxID=2053492 RepID=UPI0025E46CA9|nr:hypothetical protein [Accumulibacter sp.]MCM8624874.1 hypothetical protein [Accumulibacter sp.]
MGNLSKSILIFYLAASALSPLVYSALASGPDRYEVQKASIEMIALSLLFISLVPKGKIRLLPVSFLFYVPLIAFVGLNVFLALSGPKGPQWAQASTFFGIAMALVCGQLSGQTARPQELTVVFKSTLCYAPAVIAALLMFLVFDRFTYPQGGAMKPVAYGGVVSTELSNIAGLAMIPYVVLFAVGRNRAGCLLALSALLAVQVWLMSLGTIIVFAVLTGVAFLLLKKAARNNLFIAFIVATVFSLLAGGSVVALYILGALDLDWLLAYTGDSYFLRLGSYDALARHAFENPLVGIGLGGFGEPPHHNILGLAAETGILSMTLYSVAAIFGTVLAGRLLVRQQSVGTMGSECAIVGVTFVLSALFLHAKGFVHDTWYQKSAYFYVAFVFGAGINHFAQRKTVSSSRAGEFFPPTDRSSFPIREVRKCAM